MTVKLEVEEVSKTFDSQAQVVNQVSLQVNEGELVVLLGTSGSGKSTLLRLISGLLLPDSGRIRLEGRDITMLPPQKRGIGFMFQHYALFGHMTVSQNVEFGLKTRGMPRAERARRRDEMLDLVGLSGFGARRPGELSGGQRQRVALARALAFNPSVLLLDEPFGALDLKIRMQLRLAFRELQRKLNITTILVTHDQDEALEIADRVGVIERGRLFEIAPPDELYQRPKTEFVAAFLGGGNVVVGKAEQETIRLGSTRLPFPSTAPTHEEGAPVRLLFRPENVVHRKEPVLNDPDLVHLGEGQVEEIVFAGPVRRMRLNLLELKGIRPVAPAPRYGQKTAIIELVEPAFGAEPVQIGDRRSLALRHYHVLEPAGIQTLALVSGSPRDREVLQTAVTLTRRAHSETTILSSADNDEEVEKKKKLLWDQLNQEEGAKEWAGEAIRWHFDVSVRTGREEDVCLERARQEFFDLVLLPTRNGAVSGVELPTPRKLRRLAEELLHEVGAPVMFVGRSPASFQRILICTAGGEPGKTDVHFACRLGRHFGSTARVFHVARPDTDNWHRKRVQEHLAQAQDILTLFGLNASVEIVEGDLEVTILNELEKGGYDLLVIGATGAGASLAFAEKLLQRTSCALLVVPSDE